MHIAFVKEVSTQNSQIPELECVIDLIQSKHHTGKLIILLKHISSEDDLVGKTVESGQRRLKISFF